MDVKNINSLEPVVRNDYRQLKVHLGCSFDRIRNSFDGKLLNKFQLENYFLCLNRRKGEVNILLSHSATNVDQLRACFHADVIEFCLRQSRDAQFHITDVNLDKAISAATSGSDAALVEHTLSYTQSRFTRFKATVEQLGWSTTVTLLNPDEWRVKWEAAFLGN